MKFRIIKLIHSVDKLGHADGVSKTEFIIEKKGFWGWKEVMSHELKPKRISHPTYEAAEAYMLHNYMGHGMCTIDCNVYTYEPYSYWY